MKRLIIIISLISFIAPSLALGVASSTSFNFTGATSSWTIPAGVSSINLNLWGAAAACNSNGGLGGSVSGTVSVSAGQVYYFYIGGKPAPTCGNSATLPSLGGAGRALGSGGDAGGEMTWFSATGNVATGTVWQSKVLAVAGGGGGRDAAGSQGGNGGGLTGGNGSAFSTPCTGGFGGSQIAGGNAGGGACKVAPNATGTAGQGGQAFPDQSWAGANPGGGGGGYWGGGAGSSDNTSRGAGGGGSSFASSTLTSTSTASGTWNTTGTIYISYDISAGNPSINLSTTTYTFTTTNTSGTETITNVGISGTTLNWTVTSSQPWLTFSALSGTATSTINFISNLWGYACGTYNATATIADAGGTATNTPQYANITASVPCASGGANSCVMSWLFQ